MNSSRFNRSCLSFEQTWIKRKETVRNMLLFSSSLNMINEFFRRTPRRKLVFSSSDDETDNSPQSISSGKMSRRKREREIDYFNWKLFTFFILVHVLRQIHQDDQWVFPLHSFIRSFVWCRKWWSGLYEYSTIHPMVRDRIIWLDLWLTIRWHSNRRGVHSTVDILRSFLCPWCNYRLVCQFSSRLEMDGCHPAISR